MALVTTAVVVDEGGTADVDHGVWVEIGLVFTTVRIV